MRTRARLAVVSAAAAMTVAAGAGPAEAAETPPDVPHPVPVGEGCPSTDGRRVVDTPPTFPRTVALTFDDGPDPTWTPQVLSVLRRHGVHGTFFVVGERAEANPTVLAEIVADGSLVGNHTWNHPTSGQGMYGLTGEQLADQMDSTQQFLMDSTGQPVCFFRAPQGKDASRLIRDAATARGLTVANMYSAHDYLQPSELTPSWVDLITEHLVDRGDHPILLLHDGGAFRGNSIAALDRVITWYSERGFVFTDPAGRPFPDDPSVRDSSVGYALAPTAEQRSARAYRSAARAVTEFGAMTNPAVSEQEKPSPGTSPATSTDPAAPPNVPAMTAPGLPVVSGQRPGLAGSAPL
jgi:peptidoglycan/xylan/chitin deacetylase (PgdA/CDA1 family)